MCLGVAFQLMDDALDYLSDEVTAGKPVGHDLEEGKITLPLIHAMSSDEELTERVGAIAERDGYEGDDRDWVRERVEAGGGVDYTMQCAADYAERAKKALPGFGDAEIFELLADLADFSAKRPF
jgi:octaprenyl-diphosphate synthase